MSEYLEINVSILNDVNFPGNATIGLAEGQTSFNADALANNVIVYEQSSLDELGDSSFLSTTPVTVLSDPSGENTIQFVLAVAETILGDVNQDGVVNFLDINPFIEVLSMGSFLAEADVNEDGEVNFLDAGPFVAILAGS